MDENSETKRIEDDYMLQILATVVDSGENEIAITLNASGLLLTGTLASFDRWLEQCKDHFSRAGDSTLIEVLGWNHAPGHDTRKTSGSELLHLLDARVVSGGVVLPSSGGVPWRVPIAQVTGWCFGEIRVGEKS